MKVENITQFTLYMIEIGQCRWSHDGPWLCELIDTDAPRIQAEEIKKGYKKWLKAKNQHREKAKSELLRGDYHES